MTSDPPSTTATTNETTSPLVDDLDLADTELGERQPEACSMEEGCSSCQ